jgi:hypothetical protein
MTFEEAEAEIDCLSNLSDSVINSDLYFIWAGTDPCIKIGRGDAVKRRKANQTGNHRPLQEILVVKKAGALEVPIHRLVRPWRIRIPGNKEWFDFGPLVDDFIETITESAKPMPSVFGFDESTWNNICLEEAVEEFVAEHCLRKTVDEFLAEQAWFREKYPSLV